MAITSKNEIADFEGPDRDPKDSDAMSNVVRAPEPIAASQAEASETSGDVADLAVPGV